MNTTEILELAAKQAGDQIIDIAQKLAPTLQPWSELKSRPNDLSQTECVGFVNNQTATDHPISLVIDIQAPEQTTEASLRLWAIYSEIDTNEIARFYNIQLTFTPDYNEAQLLAAKAGDLLLEDVRRLLYSEETELTQVVVSNNSGFDQVSEETFGERYDIDLNQVVDSEDVDQATLALPVVSDKLRVTAG